MRFRTQQNALEFATVTLASPPPKLAAKPGVCKNRSNAGAAKRNITSPNVTVDIVLSIRSRLMFSVELVRQDV